MSKKQESLACYKVGSGLLMGAEDERLIKGSRPVGRTKRAALANRHLRHLVLCKLCSLRIRRAYTAVAVIYKAVYLYYFRVTRKYEAAYILT
jgi:hypothetical protein